MFALRRETDYAIQFIMFLAQQKKHFCSLKEFATKANISFFFMQKIARRLHLAGMIEAGQGINGGYHLRVGRISLRDIIEAMEGKVALLPCFKNIEPKCAKQGVKCELKSMLIKLNKEICKKLSAVKIAPT